VTPLPPLQSAALALCAAGTLAAQTPVGGRWAKWGGLRLGASIDDLLALNSECVNLDESVQAGGAPITTAQLATWAFGFSLPHQDRDAAAVRRAFGHAMVCRGTILDGQGRFVAVAIDRTVIGVTALFLPDSATTVTLDSVRRSLRHEWGPPTAPTATLDSWLGSRYRAYLMVPYRPAAWHGPRPFNVILIDVNACSAFDRRIHRFAGGQPAPC
jgi:hypothetical protein